MKMNTCKTCKFWRDPNLYSCNERKLCATTIFLVKICDHPDLNFCEPPVYKNGFSVGDGEDYFAALATAEEFGCVKHEHV